jgi:hypothetical protein
MENDLWSYLERLEFLAFFSAYPIVFALVHVIAGYGKKGIIKKLPSLLPYAYALIGFLYLGLQLRNLYPDYSIVHLKAGTEQPLLKIWALLSILFFIPALAKKTVISLLHSLIFFFFLLKDLLWNGDKNIVRNDMKVYTDSLLINLAALLVIVFFYLLIRFMLKSRTPNN